MKTRGRFSAEFKAKVALEAIRGVESNPIRPGQRLGFVPPRITTSRHAPRQRKEPPRSPLLAPLAGAGPQYRRDLAAARRAGRHLRCSPPAAMPSTPRSPPRSPSSVVEPTGNGLGSDAFCDRLGRQDLHGLNASGRSPAAWTPERFPGGMAERGWDSVTVPGAVAPGSISRPKFGRLPFEKLFEPAIGYAENGYLVSPVIAAGWARAEIRPGAPARLRGGVSPRWPRAESRRAVFSCKPMAESLRLIAAPRARPSIAANWRRRSPPLPASMAGHDGADLAEHRNDWCGTISKEFGDVALHEIPPNGQGIAACMALGILRHVGLDRYDPDSVEALHLQIEAMKLAFRDIEAYVADPTR
jgi:gamma-glutamyltranspeptidase / glutathione hydrolase